MEQIRFTRAVKAGTGSVARLYACNYPADTVSILLMTASGRWRPVPEIVIALILWANLIRQHGVYIRQGVHTQLNIFL
jgi:hypothetical protein